jgi:hypothetical protein
MPEGLEVHERSQCPKLLAPGKCKKPTVMIGADIKCLVTNINKQYIDKRNPYSEWKSLYLLSKDSVTNIKCWVH